MIIGIWRVDVSKGWDESLYWILDTNGYIYFERGRFICGGSVIFKHIGCNQDLFQVFDIQK